MKTINQNNMDISCWKEFKFTEVFTIKKGFYNKKPEVTIEGNIPFLGATEKNNGITGYFSLEDIKSSSKTGDGKNAPIEEKLFPKNALCITNNGSVGFAYFQNQPFTCSHDVNPLYLKEGEFNYHTALFVATLIHKDRYRWAYGRKWRPERMVESSILLPVNAESKPDWQFMENHMKTLNHKPITTTVTEDERKQEPVTYAEFKVSEVFHVRYGVNLELNTCEEVPPDTKGAVNFVSRSRENNGVTAHIKRIPDISPLPAGLITVAGGGSSVLSTFVQNKPFYSGRDLYILESKEELSISSKIYLSTIIMQNKYKYSFGRQANKTLASIKINLPIKSNGKINYKYIDNYISSLPYSDKLNLN